MKGNATYNTISNAMLLSIISLALITCGQKIIRDDLALQTAQNNVEEHEKKLRLAEEKVQQEKEKKESRRIELRHLSSTNGGYKNVPWGITTEEYRDYYDESINVGSYNSRDSRYFFKSIISTKYGNKEDFSSFTVIDENSKVKINNNEQSNKFTYVFLKNKLVAVELNLMRDNLALLKKLKRKYSLLRNKTRKTQHEISASYKRYRFNATMYNLIFNKDENTHIAFIGLVHDKDAHNKRVFKELENDLKQNPLGMLGGLLMGNAFGDEGEGALILFYDYKALNKYNRKMKKEYMRKRENEDNTIEDMM